jgi:peptide/nickel transport system substrate-binding protein
MSWVLAVALAAALLGATTPAAQAKDSLTIALPTDIATMDPLTDNALVSFPLRLNVFNALTEIGPDGALLPRLAVSWEGSPDARDWTFELRQGARFQNGEPVTADDVIFSYQQIIDDKASPVRGYLVNVAGIDRVSDHSVRFRLTDPYALWPRQAMTMAIVPRDAYLKMGPKQFGLTPIGSGPYRVTEWLKDDHISLTAFDGYWGGAPKIKNVIFRPIPSEPSRASALLTGEVDIVPSLGAAAARGLTGKSGVSVRKAPGFKVVYLGFNPAFPALNDVRMRQAIDMAIDRAALTGKLLRGSATPVGQIVSSLAFGYDPAMKPTEYNPDGARELVRQAGYSGEPIPLQYNNDFIASGDDVAQAVAGYLKAVGINVATQALDYTSFITLWSKRKMPGIHLFVWGGVLLDADTQIMSNYATVGARGYLFDPRVDALAAEQRAEIDPVKRQALISELWHIADSYKPDAFLYNESQLYGVRTGVNWTPSPDGIVRLMSISMDQ